MRSDVDLQATGGVDDHDVATEARRFLHRAARHADRIGVAREHRDLDALAEHAQLLHRRGPLEVGTDEERTATLLLEQARQLRRRGGLARTLQARHHHDRRRLRRDRQLAGGAAERGHQLFVDDLDDLLRRAQALRDLRALRALLDPVDEVAGDAHVDVGLEQRDAQLTRDFVDVLVGELAAAAQLAEDAVETVGERLEHCGSG